MTRSNLNRAGMVLVVVVVGLIVVTIFFATMVGRVRHETGLTARASINERLYQIASAIGRITVRKLQRDFEKYDKESEQNIMDMVFNKKKKIKDVSFDDVISNLDVVKQIKEEFKKRWGDLDITVTYSVEVPDKNDFPAFIPGLQNSQFERRGYISADVTVTHRNHTKRCKISKQFLLTRLFAAPFHRFSLFVSNAASVDTKKINRLTEFSEDGTVLDVQPPLQLFNQRVTGNTGIHSTLNDVNYNNMNPTPVVNSADSFTQNGWIYLGSGSSDDSIKLKIISGSLGGMPDDAADTTHHKKYGEYFHLFYTDKTYGWRGSQAWANWLNTRLPGVADGESPTMKICYVDYGHFRFAGGNQAIKFTEIEAPANSGQNLFAGFKFEDMKGSALHLFGTPTICTPTLIFGNVQRMFLRISAFLFSGDVWPISYMGKEEYKGLLGRISSWLGSLGGKEQAKQAIKTFLPETAGGASLDYDRYYEGNKKDAAAGQPLTPQYCSEPYLRCLVNLAKPQAVEAWANVDALRQSKYLTNGPDELCKSDYEFKSDEYLHYTGRIKSLKVDSKYFDDALRQRTSYFITQKPDKNDVLPLSKCNFFQDEFIDPDANCPNNKKACYLNQIVGFESSVEIDQPLLMIKGGIIWSKKDIIITRPIINPMVYPKEYNAKTPDDFGWLTLVAGGNIRILTGAFPKGETKGYPEIHAFLVACNGGTGKVVPDNPIHLIGGVAVDDMNPLLEKGGVIEWGFLRGELCERFSSSGKNDMTGENFHGLSMGPMDGEYVFE